MTEVTKNTRKILSEKGFNYCPYCGRKLSKEEHPVRWGIINGKNRVTKTNEKVVCETHGELYI